MWSGTCSLTYSFSCFVLFFVLSQPLRLKIKALWIQFSFTDSFSLSLSLSLSLMDMGLNILLKKKNKLFLILYKFWFVSWFISMLITYMCKFVCDFLSEISEWDLNDDWQIVLLRIGLIWLGLIISRLKVLILFLIFNFFYGFVY